MPYMTLSYHLLNLTHSGARVVVNDNPRYDGERLPVYFYGNRG
uniref:Alpha/beta hydrolase n=1 Tax=Steinernema glaseri TaxID=37863 RepID=A0A1I8AE75_9BILA